MRKSKPILAAALCLGGVAVAFPPSTQAETGRSVALILDASGCMGARLPDGVSKMDAGG